MRINAILATAFILASSPAWGSDDSASGSVAQFYSYRLTDAAQFREGYRAHLDWHARQGDTLAWYAWFVRSGPRHGMFIDGTAGADWSGLDNRPDPAGDAADFAGTAAQYAEAGDVETWQLWLQPSTATPLEDRQPTAFIDVFLLEVAPANAQAFEEAIGALATHKPATGAKLTWYRKVRGGAAPVFKVMLSRERWADVGKAGGTLWELLSGNYNSADGQIGRATSLISSMTVETWEYEPRLSQLPPLELDAAEPGKAPGGT